MSAQSLWTLCYSLSICTEQSADTKKLVSLLAVPLSLASPLHRFCAVFNKAKRNKLCTKPEIALWIKEINTLVCYYFPYLHTQFNIHLLYFSNLNTALLCTWFTNNLIREYCLAVVLPMTENFKILTQYHFCALEEEGGREFFFPR